MVGITYDSECHLLRSKCLSYDSLISSNLTIVHRGHCNPDTDPDGHGKKSNLCAKSQCQFSAICKELIPGITSCHCPECRADQRPVCGSDGTTYQNECYVRKNSCETSSNIEIHHEGHCDQENLIIPSSSSGPGSGSNGMIGRCDTMKCPPYATCEINMYGDPECICPSVCLRIDSPVCGSDGKTYENECEVRIKSCKTEALVKISHKGQCGKKIRFR